MMDKKGFHRRLNIWYKLSLFLNSMNMKSGPYTNDVNIFNILLPVRRLIFGLRVHFVLN